MKKLELGEMGKSEIEKEREDIKSMMAYLESEYRKANISEKTYSELKKKYSKKLEEKRKKPKNRVKIRKIESKAEEKVEEEKETPEIKERGKPKIGLFKRLFGRKEKKEEEVKEEATDTEVEAVMKTQQEKVAPLPETIESPKEKLEVVSVEIEKLKAMIDSMREEKRATDETIRAISESLGELRSMVFHADASLREGLVKVERLEDEISEIKPKEINKKFRVVNEGIEKHETIIEKLDRKSEDLAEKINKVYEILKKMGSVENLLKMSKDIRKRVEDVNEAVKYIERLGSKTEKIFIDLTKSLEDFVKYKTRQEDLEESMKDIIKSIDAFNVKFEGYVSKKDLDTFKEDILVIKKQIEEINKVLPIVQVKLPESILSLRKEREDIILLLDSLEEQMREGKISKEEYENIKNSNKKRLEEIEKELIKEWKEIERLLKAEKKVEVSEIKKPEVVEKVEIEEKKPEERVEEKIKGEVEIKPIRKKEEEKGKRKKHKIKKKYKKKKSKERKESRIDRRKKILSEIKKLKV